MYSTDTLVRQTDGKEFTVKHHGHWSDIVSSDGEVDYIKWLCGDGTGKSGAEYVSHSKGHGYYIKPR
jgi:hypothetical protein